MFPRRAVPGCSLQQISNSEKLKIIRNFKIVFVVTIVYMWGGAMYMGSCVYGGLCIQQHTFVGQGTDLGSVLSFHFNVNSRGQTQVCRLALSAANAFIS